MKPYTQTNYTRLIVCSNCIQPIEVPHGDRRFAIFKAQRKKPSPDYFSRYWELIYDKNALYTLYKYLMELNIEGFSLRHNRPITTAYKVMAENCVHPFYYFMNEVFESKEFDCFGENNYDTNDNTIIVSPHGLFNAYKEHISETNQQLGRFKQSHIVGMFEKLDVYKKVMRYNGSNVKWFVIDICKITEELNTMCMIDESEIIEWVSGSK